MPPRLRAPILERAPDFEPERPTTATGLLEALKGPAPLTPDLGRQRRFGPTGPEILVNGQWVSVAAPTPQALEAPTTSILGFPIPEVLREAEAPESFVGAIGQELGAAISAPSRAVAAGLTAGAPTEEEGRFGGLRRAFEAGQEEFQIPSAVRQTLEQLLEERGIGEGPGIDITRSRLLRAGFPGGAMAGLPLPRGISEEPLGRLTTRGVLSAVAEDLPFLGAGAAVRGARGLVRGARTAVQALLPEETFLHGTRRSFQRIAPQGTEPIYLTKVPEVARMYALPVQEGEKGRVLRFTIKPEARVMDLRRLPETEAIGTITERTRGRPLLQMMQEDGIDVLHATRNESLVANAAVLKGSKTVLQKLEELLPEGLQFQARRVTGRLPEPVAGGAFEDLAQTFDDLTEEIVAAETKLAGLRGDGTVPGLVRPRRGAAGISDQGLMRLAEENQLNPFQADWFDSIDPVVVRDFRQRMRTDVPKETQIKQAREGLADLRRQRDDLSKELDRRVAAEGTLGAHMGINQMDALSRDVFLRDFGDLAAKTRREMSALELAQATLDARRRIVTAQQTGRSAEGSEELVAWLGEELASRNITLPTDPAVLARMVRRGRITPEEAPVTPQQAQLEGPPRETFVPEGAREEVQAAFPGVRETAAAQARRQTEIARGQAELPLAPELVGGAPDSSFVTREGISATPVEDSPLLAGVREASAETGDLTQGVQQALSREAGEAGLPPPRDPPVVSSMSGNTRGNPPGAVHDMAFGIPGESNARAALRKWSGARDTLALETKQWWQQGQERLRALGVGTRAGGRQVFTRDEMEGLFKALHGEGDVPLHLRPVYDDIRRLVAQENSDMLAVDKSFSRMIMAHPDYFPRGWREPRITAPAGRARMGARPGFLKPRTKATFSEMLESGWEPLSWNPYDMMALRRIAGVEHRESMVLVERLRKWGQLAPEREAPKSWRVPTVGPAFEGRAYSRSDGGVGFTNRLAVPNAVADALEGVYGVAPRLSVRGTDIVPWLRRFSNAPKRAKLFGSLFQHVDFATRAGFVALTPTGISRGAPLKYPSLVARMMNVSLRKTPREALAKKLLGTEEIGKGSGVSLRTIAEEGWQIGGDPSILRRSMLSFLDDVSRTPPQGAARSGIRKVGERISAVARFFEDGLFDGVYRETQAWALENFIVPKLRRLHPEWTPRQIAGSAAEEVNKMFSALGEWQTIFNQPAMREFSRSLLFSSNETEGWIRQAVSTVKGQNKRLWQEYAVGMMLFLAASANAVNILSTGEPLPLASYSPVSLDNPYSPLPGGVAYNTRFMSPQLPWDGAQGQPLFLDLVGQADTFMRWALDPIGALGSRVNVLPRAIMNQLQSEDFFGRPVEGIGGRARQAVADIFTPIGLGNVGEILRGVLPEAEGPLPIGETEVGRGGLAVQALGLNVRAEGTRRLMDKALQRLDWRTPDGKRINKVEDLGPRAYLAFLEASREEQSMVDAIRASRKEGVGGIIREESQREMNAAARNVARALPRAMQTALTDNLVFVPGVQRSIAFSGERWFLNDARYRRYQALYAERIEAVVQQIIEHPRFSDVPQEHRQEALKEAISEAGKAARALMLREGDQESPVPAEVGGGPQRPAAPPQTVAELLEALRAP